MKCILHKQKPKIDKKGVEGSLSVHDLPPNGLEACFIQNDRIIDVLRKPDIIFINAHGILLKGYEPAGTDRQHRQKFVYQEWFCVFIKRAIDGRKL